MFGLLIIIYLLALQCFIITECKENTDLLKWNHKQILLKSIDNIEVDLVEINSQKDIDSIVKKLKKYSKESLRVKPHSRIASTTRRPISYYTTQPVSHVSKTMTTTTTTTTITPTTTTTKTSTTRLAYSSNTLFQAYKPDLTMNSTTRPKSNSSTFKKALKDIDMLDNTQIQTVIGSYKNVETGKGFFEILRDIFQIDSS